MARKSNLAPEENPDIIPVKPEMEDLVAEAEQIRTDELQKAEDTRIKAEEEAKNPKQEVNIAEELEKSKKETIETVTKEVVEPLKKEIIDLKQTLTPVEKDDYEKFVDSYTEKNGKAPEWKEVAMFLEDRAVNRIKDEQKAQEDAKTKADEEAKEAQKNTENENFKIWQTQMLELEEKGLIPKMEKQEKGDAGFDARVRLYGNMQATWQTPTPSTNLWEIHAKYYKPVSAQPAGGNAPVSMGESGGSEDDAKDYKYSDIHVGPQGLEALITRELTKAGR